MAKEQPYFMLDKNWYIFNEEKWKYELTDKAPLEAVKSYNEFYHNPDLKNIKDEKENEVDKASQLYGINIAK